MSVHKKLMQARVKLQSTEMKKSGLNKFAGYSYFELGDFIPHIQTIFNDIGLCGVVSFNTEYATLCITDVDDGTVIVITSPMAKADLKGAHPIQNLGAVESYQRRYLWMTAMEIVEHDIIDSAPSAEPKPEPKPEPKLEPKPEPVKKTPVPLKMEGRDDKSWHLIVEKEPGDSSESWITAVVDITKMGLAETHNEADVMKLFTNNRIIFDRLKLEDVERYTALMGAFKTRKEELKG
jgi:hypothetical protein